MRLVSIGYRGQESARLRKRSGSILAVAMIGVSILSFMILSSAQVVVKSHRQRAMEVKREQLEILLEDSLKLAISVYGRGEDFPAMTVWDVPQEHWALSETGQIRILLGEVSKGKQEVIAVASLKQDQELIHQLTRTIRVPVVERGEKS